MLIVKRNGYLSRFVGTECASLGCSASSTVLLQSFAHQFLRKGSIYRKRLLFLAASEFTVFFFSVWCRCGCCHPYFKLQTVFLWLLSVYLLMEFSWKLIQLKAIYLLEILCKHKDFFCKNVYYQFWPLESCFYCLIIVLLNILRLKYGDFVLLTIRCVCNLITTQDPVEMTFY